MEFRKQSWRQSPKWSKSNTTTKRDIQNQGKSIAHRTDLPAAATGSLGMLSLSNSNSHPCENPPIVSQGYQVGPSNTINSLLPDISDNPSPKKIANNSVQNNKIKNMHHNNLINAKNSFNDLMNEDDSKIETFVPIHTQLLSTFSTPPSHMAIMQEFPYSSSSSIDGKPNSQPFDFPANISSLMFQNHANDFPYRVSPTTVIVQPNIVQNILPGVILSPNINFTASINDYGLNTTDTLYNANPQNLFPLYKALHPSYPSRFLS